MVLGHDRSGPPGAPMTSVEIALPTRMWEGIKKKAAQQGVPTRVYVGHLLSAAYTARVLPQGDREMEAAVERAFARPPAKKAPSGPRTHAERPSAADPIDKPTTVVVEKSRRVGCTEAQARLAATAAPPAVFVQPAPVEAAAPAIADPAPVVAITSAAPTLSAGQLRLIRAYRSMKWLPKQIADAVGVDVELVQREMYPGRT